MNMNKCTSNIECKKCHDFVKYKLDFFDVIINNKKVIKLKCPKCNNTYTIDISKNEYYPQIKSERCKFFKVGCLMFSCLMFNFILSIYRLNTLNSGIYLNPEFYGSIIYKDMAITFFLYIIFMFLYACYRYIVGCNIIQYYLSLTDHIDTDHIDIGSM